MAVKRHCVAAKSAAAAASTTRPVAPRSAENHRERRGLRRSVHCPQRQVRQGAKPQRRSAALMPDYASHSHEVRKPTPRRLGPPTRQSPLLPKPSPARPIWPIVSASASSTASSRQSRPIGHRPMDTDLLCPYAGVQIANLLTRHLQQARPCQRCDTNADASGQIQLRQGRKRHDNNCAFEQYSDDGVGAQVVTTCRRQAGALAGSASSPALRQCSG